MHEVILVVDNKMWVQQELLDLVKFYPDMSDLQIMLILLGQLELYPIKTIPTILFTEYTC
jgi:hypothetical protein